MSAPEPRRDLHQRNRAARRAANERRFSQAIIKPPTEAQLDFLRELCADTGQRFTKPTTMQQASGRIRDLLILRRRKPKK
jgi:hypothetical protein